MLVCWESLVTSVLHPCLGECLVSLNAVTPDRGHISTAAVPCVFSTVDGLHVHWQLTLFFFLTNLECWALWGHGEMVLIFTSPNTIFWILYRQYACIAACMYLLLPSICSKLFCSCSVELQRNLCLSGTNRVLSRFTFTPSDLSHCKIPLTSKWKINILPHLCSLLGYVKMVLQSQRDQYSCIIYVQSFK